MFFFFLMYCQFLVPFERRNGSGLVNKATEPLLREAKVSRRLLLIRSQVSMAEDPLFSLRATCHHPSFILDTPGPSQLPSQSILEDAQPHPEDAQPHLEDAQFHPGLGI